MLEQLRIKKGYTQVQIVKILGVSRRAWQNWITSPETLCNHKLQGMLKQLRELPVLKRKK